MLLLMSFLRDHAKRVLGPDDGRGPAAKVKRDVAPHGKRGRAVLAMVVSGRT